MAVIGFSEGTQNVHLPCIAKQKTAGPSRPGYHAGHARPALLGGQCPGPWRSCRHGAAARGSGGLWCHGEMGRLRQPVHHCQGRGLPQGQARQQSGDAQRQAYRADGAGGVQGPYGVHVQGLYQPGVPVRAGQDLRRRDPPQPAQSPERRRNHHGRGHRQEIGQLQARFPFHRSLGQGAAQGSGMELRPHRAERRPATRGLDRGARRQTRDRSAGGSRH
ncbi:hypothetical protein D3C80_764370 [compost metagenome]